MTLVGGVGVGAGVVLVRGVDGTPAGLATGVPPAVMTVWAFCGGVIFTDTAAPLGATVMAFWRQRSTVRERNHRTDQI